MQRTKTFSEPPMCELKRKDQPGISVSSKFYQRGSLLSDYLLPIQGLKSSFRFDDRLFVIRRQKIIDVSYFFTRKSRPATILQKAPQVHHDAHLLSLTGPQLTVLLGWTFDNHSRTGFRSNTTLSSLNCVYRLVLIGSLLSVYSSPLPIH